MAIDFPDTPAENDTFTASGKTWVYIDGKWAVQTITNTFDLKAPLASPTFTGTVSGVSASMVGLGNVDNTSDVDKPVSTAGQTALDLKANLSSPTFTGTTTTNDLTVSGNFVVSGTTTSINTETVTVNDNIIVLNNNATGDPTDDAGIEIERGSSTNVQLLWNETSDKWQFTNDGSTYTDLGAGGATISDTAPASPVLGQVWFDSSSAKAYVYYDSSWVEIGAGSNPAALNDVGDVTITSATNGQFLKWNGSAWVNDSIPTINTLDDVGDVTITSVATGQLLQWNGTAWVNASFSSDLMTDARNAALILMDIGA